MKKILTTIFLLTSIIFFSQEMNNDSIIETKINELARQVSSVDNNLIGHVEKLKEILNSINAFQDNIDRISSENKIFADSISDIITSVDYRLLRLDSLINILHKDLDSNKIDNNKRFEDIINESESLRRDLKDANINVTKIENSSSKIRIRYFL